MKITKHSRSRVVLSASRWTVAREYFDPLYNYLVYGFDPGSFWCAVLANDFFAAVSRSHPSNDIPSLKHAVGWIRDCFPPESHGDYQRIEMWIRLDPHHRRRSLESMNLVYTEQEEIMLGLRGDKVPAEPILW